MTRILLLSDTHSHFDERLLPYIQDSDQVWHAGDIGAPQLASELKALKNLKAVYGNIDGTPIRKEYPKNALFMCEQVKVFITHIGGYPGRYTAEVKEILQKEKPQIYICGHSHILKVMYDKTYQVLHLNPGAAGLHGFHQVITALKFEINGTSIEKMQVIELPKISGYGRHF